MLDREYLDEFKRDFIAISRSPTRDSIPNVSLR